MKTWTPTDNEKAKALYATGMTHRQVGERFGRTPNAMKAWVRRNGVIKEVSRCKRIPDDFAEYYPAHTNLECCEHWNVCDDTVRAWRIQTGVPVKLARPARTPIPDDFEQQVPHLTMEQCVARWGFARNTIVRMCNALGVTPMPYKPAPRVVIRKASIPLAVGDVSLAGAAANFLRRTHPNVFKASILSGGELRRAGASRDDYFVSGKGFMPPATVIALAEAMGMRASA